MIAFKKDSFSTVLKNLLSYYPHKVREDLLDLAKVIFNGRYVSLYHHIVDAVCIQTVCPRCLHETTFVQVHGHYQCAKCNSIVDDCCQGEVCDTPKKKLSIAEEFKLKPIDKSSYLGFNGYGSGRKTLARRKRGKQNGK